MISFCNKSRRQRINQRNRVNKPPFSVPGSPRFRGGAVTPGDMGTLTEEMQSLQTSDYGGNQVWQGLRGTEEEEDGYPLSVLLFCSSLLRRCVSDAAMDVALSS
jgi:hypothetical protein